MSWLIHRLRLMPPAELFARAVEAVRHLYLLPAHRFVGRAAAPGPAGDGDGLGDPLPELGDCRPPPEARAAVEALAERWLHHRGDCFELRHLELGDPIDWLRDPATGLRTPRRYAARINHRRPAVAGDVRYLWELNRLQHLVPMALAARWSGEGRFETGILAQIRSWREQNPFMVGLNWKSPLEAGLRLLTWAFVWRLLGGSPAARRALRAELGRTLYEHQYFVSRFYSRHSSANNHLVGEMAGLYAAATLWPWFRPSAAWRRLARTKLIEAMALQVEEDGVGRERSSEYQLFVLELFLVAAALGQATGDPFPASYWRRLEAMAVFVAAVSDREGHFPRLGDGDDSQVLRLPEPTEERAATLGRLPDPEPAAGGPFAALRRQILLWGQESSRLPWPGAARPPVVPGPAPGGYHLLEAGRGGPDELLVCFDAGPLGLAPLNAHGHADALAFWLSWRGREFLVDPGTYCYYSHARWRAYFRGTAAHNTIRVDGLDQSVPGGRFLWRSAASCRPEAIEAGADSLRVAAVHDGYRRLPDPVIHRRTLELSPSRRALSVEDALEAAGRHEVELFLHFDERCRVAREGDSFVAVHDGRRLEVRLDPALRATLRKGAESPPSGWVSREFGLRRPAFTLVGRAELDGALSLRTEIRGLRD